MSDYSKLKAAIRQVIKQNGNNEITGDLLQQTLLSMVNTLGEGRMYMGIAIPQTTPPITDGNVFYIASKPGVYSGFGSKEVKKGTIGIFTNIGVSWNLGSIDLSNFGVQMTEDNALQTEDKTIIGAINEVNKIAQDAQPKEPNKGLSTNDFTNDYKEKVDNSLLKINQVLTAEEQKQVLSNIGAQSKTDNTLNTENKTVVGAINEVVNETGLDSYSEFSVEESYNIGDVVKYGSNLYRFTVGHPAGAWLGTDAEQTSVKEELDRAVAMKANVDGYYETMRVGTADNLTARGEVSEEIIMSRTAGGNNVIESGDASIKSIKGYSVVMNQFLTLRKTDYTTDYGLTLHADGNVISIAGQLPSQEPGKDTNVYLSVGKVIRITSMGEKFLISLTGKNFKIVAFEAIPDSIGFAVINQVTNLNKPLSLAITPDKWGIAVNEEVNVRVINLTQMFGASNEPATPEEFAHRLGYDSIEQVPYIPYNEGEIVSCNAEGIRTTDAEGDTYERKWATTLHEYFPRGLQSVGNVYDEITPTKAIKRISNDREILLQPEEYPYDELNLTERVVQGGKEEAIIPEGVLSTPLKIDVVYPIDTYGTIVNNKKNIGNISQLQTSAKTDLVSAINENNQLAKDSYPTGGYMAELYEAAGARYNEEKGVWALNGIELTDKEIAVAYNSSLGLKSSVLDEGCYGSLMKTNFPGALRGGFGTISAIACFAGCSKLEIVNLNNTTRYFFRSIAYMFLQCSILQTVSSIIDVTHCTIKSNTIDAFKLCDKLKNVKLKGLNIDISFSDSPLLTVEDTEESTLGYLVANAINKGPITVTLHADAYARVPESLKTKAQGKQISIVSA